VQADEQANVQPEPAVPQVQNLPVPVIPPVQQVLPPVQPVPTQNQGVQAEPVVANGVKFCLNNKDKSMYSKFHILSFSVCGRKMSNSFEKVINIGVCVSFVQGLYMPRVRGRRARPINPAGLVYRQRLRAREHRAVQQEVIRPRRTRNPRNIQPVQADEQANEAINIGLCVSFVQGIFNRFSPFATTGSACTP
jgi:hypothetical protein